MGSHGINGEGAPFKVELAEQAGDGFGLIAFPADELLGKGDAAVRNPRAERVDRFGFQTMATLRTLAVQGDDPIRRNGLESAGMFCRAGFEKIGINDRKDV